MGNSLIKNIESLCKLDNCFQKDTSKYTCKFERKNLKLIDNVSHEKNIFYVYYDYDDDKLLKRPYQEFIKAYYYSNIVEDFFEICYEGIIKIMFLSAILLLIIAWIFMLCSWDKSLIQFSINMIIVLLAYSVYQEKLIKKSFDIDRSDYDHIIYYEKKIIENENFKPKYKSDSIVLSGFIWFLITFSFYITSVT